MASILLPLQTHKNLINATLMILKIRRIDNKHLTKTKSQIKYFTKWRENFKMNKAAIFYKFCLNSFYSITLTSTET